MMHKLTVFASMLMIVLVGSSGVVSDAVRELKNVKYQNELTLNFPVAKINEKKIYDEVEKRNVTLYQYISEDGFPVYYSRSVHTGVCYDNQCKLLDITLYWNPTGRYLGFELPENEFLSKDDHVPFTEEEYVRLNQLLSDPSLPLGQFTYNQIAAKSKASLYNVDGVSGATSKDVLEYVIKGSAYTTYTIYELVYGTSQTEVEAWTNDMMNDEFLRTMITEAPYQDKLWAIDLMHGRLSDFPKSREIVLDLMGSADYSLAEKCLNSLVPKDLFYTDVQNKLMDNFQSFDFGMRSRAVELLKDAPQISPEVVVKLNGQLSGMEVPIIAGILDVYREQGIDDRETLSTIKELTNSENRYLAKKAEDYMSSLKN
ncbi:hypothetical protein [Algoriphagus terrigena]|uniref:hypothetical protein n=1 Tax=Algoriphagus terrigena TaxID=344884 RepID=UPI0012F80EC9|nr:hypothetical protein [Algoriphagus terrigena]